MKMTGTEKGVILGIVLVGLVKLTVIGAIIYAAVHFITKYW